MATDLAIAGTGCLTLAESETAQAILNAADERQLDDRAFADVERFALRERPELPVPTEAEVKAIIGALAGTLKAPRTSIDKGRLQLAMYSRALQGVELFRLQLAAEYFIKTAEWMPTPGQVRTQALHYVHPVHHAHARAKRFLRERQHRLMHVRLVMLQVRKLDQAELDNLTEMERRVAIDRGLIVPTPEGGVVYRSAAALARWEEHQRQLTKQFLIDNQRSPE